MEKETADKLRASLPTKKSNSAKPISKSSAQIRISIQRPKALKALSSQSKHHTVTEKWTDKVIRKDSLTSLAIKTSDAPSHLTSQRVQRFHPKKTASTLEEMVELQERCGQKIDLKVTVSQNAREKQDQDELWRDMIKPHVERQFQIDRIANFFT